jgi:hypothetical protein
MLLRLCYMHAVRNVFTLVAKNTVSKKAPRVTLSLTEHAKSSSLQ